MKLFENGVGRPSNEIKRKRKIFIASAVILCIALVSVLAFALTRVRTDKLQGAAKGTRFINLKVKNSAISASGCTITIPYIIENRSNQLINVYSAKILTTDGQFVVDTSVSGTIPAGKGNTDTIYAKFNVTPSSKKLLTGGEKRTTIYFKVNGKEYWHTEWVTPSENVYSIIKNCETTTSSTTKLKDGLKITCGTATVDKDFTCSTNVKGATITTKATKYLKKGYKTSNKNSIKLNYTINGSVTLVATAPGYKSTSKTIKVNKGNNSSGTVSPTNKTNKVTSPLNNSSSSTTKLKDGLKITCVSATVDKDFTCSTNVKGATITTKATKYLKKGYKTSNKNSIKLNYTINGSVTLVATAPGYKSTSKTIKVNKGNISLTCSKAYLNEDFTCKSSVTGATLKTNGTTYLKKGYKSSNKNSLKLNYTKTGTIKVTASKSGYNTKTISVKVVKRTTTTKKDDNFSSDALNYGIYKVMKNENFGSKNVEFKINRVGSDVEKVQFVVCNDKEQCVNYNTNSNNPTTGLKDAKVGNVYKLNIFTPYDELLDQKFFVRMISYDKNGKEIYFKVHEFYTNLATDKSSPNKNVSKEEDVEIGDFTGTTHDFIYSEHNKQTLKNGKLNYGIPSITKLDNNGNKQLNIFIKEWDSKVKYVTYVVCNSEADCNKSDAIEQVSKNNEIGTVVKDVEVSRGAKIEITLNSKTKNLLKQKVYVRIFTYDSNKNVLFTKMHEFSTLSYTKKGTKKESDIQIGERAATSQKFINHQILTN